VCCPDARPELEVPPRFYYGDAPVVVL